MNIDLMRNIDYYVGVPLCALFSGVDRVLRLIRPRPKIEKLERALFIELSEMGSAVLADPCMLRLKKAQVEIYFLIFKKNRASLRLLGTVPEENVFTLRESSIALLLWDSLRFVFWCREKKIQATIDLELFSRVTSLLTWASLAPMKIGFHKFHQEGLYRGEFLSHKVPYNPQIHIAHNFMNLIEATLGGMSSDGIFKRALSEDDRKMRRLEISLLDKKRVTEKIDQALGTRFAQDSVSGKLPIFLVNANAGEFLPQRKWPKAHFVDLILEILREYPSHYVLLTGAPAEAAENDLVVKKLNHPRCLNFAGKVEFLELPVLYSLSRLLITNDSGPGHFSSITDIRSYVFFGPETPDLYGSLGDSFAFYAKYSCSPCVSATNHRKTNCADNLCLQVITPKMVIERIKKEFPQV